MLPKYRRNYFSLQGIGTMIDVKVNCHLLLVAKGQKLPHNYLRISE